MNNIIADLFWNHDEIFRRAERLCETIPGYLDAKRQYDDAAEKIQEIVGDDLYEQYFTQLIHYTNYEICAYYSCGLGLREDIVQAFRL